jgi:hypothetical protein
MNDETGRIACGKRTDAMVQWDQHVLIPDKLQLPERLLVLASAGN